MSDVLTGNPGNITTQLASTVTALTNNGSGAIRVTTSAPHHYATNDYVLVNAGSTDAVYQITSIDSTHFDLVGSTSVSGGSGSATDLSLTPQIQVPTDGDPFSSQMSGLLSAFESVMDRTQWLALHAEVLDHQVFTSAGTFTAPQGSRGVATIIAELVGGGGGGGGGAGGDSGSSGQSTGGGGGAGGMRVVQTFTIASGTVLTITPGTGGGVGLAGNAGISGGTAGDGATSVILDPLANVLASAAGGQGGQGGNHGAGASASCITPGGSGPANSFQAGFYVGASGSLVPLLRTPGEGGFSVNQSFAGNGPFNGNESTLGTAGGNGGALGANASGASPPYGGGGGGGGGGGPYKGGFGGNGGAGGAGQTSGTGSNGGAGQNGTVGGGGGGGGGAGGYGGSAGGDGGVGGSGATGAIVLTFLNYQVNS